MKWAKVKCRSIDEIWFKIGPMNAASERREINAIVHLDSHNETLGSIGVAKTQLCFSVPHNLAFI
jgi:hypothetical protein